jgi:hypothetical protein
MYNVNVKNNCILLIYQQFNKNANVIIQIVPLIVLSSYYALTIHNYKLNHFLCMLMCENLMTHQVDVQTNTSFVLAQNLFHANKDQLL